jgi:hypothetical protein
MSNYVCNCGSAPMNHVGSSPSKLQSSYAAWFTLPSPLAVVAEACR